MTAAPPPLCIGLITCEREGYTAQTLHSFSTLNPDLKALKLHADDASSLRSNEQMAQNHGFKTIWTGAKRLGQLAMLRKLVEAAVARGCTWFMLLENDWKWVRSLPAEPTLPREIDSIRLYGRFKGPGDTRPAQLNVMGSDKPIIWNPYSNGWQLGLAHWGGPPSITRIGQLLLAMEKATNLKTISLQSRHFRTLRPTRNFVFHIGDEQTPDFTP